MGSPRGASQRKRYTLGLALPGLRSSLARRTRAQSTRVPWPNAYGHGALRGSAVPLARAPVRPARAPGRAGGRP
eukprot:3148966-Prymnesium_polylepis.1